MIKDYLREEFDRFASKVARLHQHKAQVNKIYTEQHQSIQKFHGLLITYLLTLARLGTNIQQWQRNLDGFDGERELVKVRSSAQLTT